MSVPVYKRTESTLQVYEFARELRKDITTVLLKRLCNDSLYNQSLVTDDNTELTTTEKYPQYQVDFIRETILGLLQQMMQNIVMANAIYPTTYVELEQRMVLQNKVIGIAEALQAEFHYCTDVFPQQLKCLLSYADSLDHLIKSARKWKRANNKIAKRIEEKQRSYPTTNFCNASNNGNANYNNAGNSNGVSPDFVDLIN